MRTRYKIDSYQQTYFVIDSFEQLFDMTAAATGLVVELGRLGDDQLGEHLHQTGDLVLFGKWSGTEVKIDGEDLLIVREADLLGIVERTAATGQQAA